MIEHDAKTRAHKVRRFMLNIDKFVLSDPGNEGFKGHTRIVVYRRIFPFYYEEIGYVKSSVPIGEIDRAIESIEEIWKNSHNNK